MPCLDAKLYVSSSVDCPTLVLDPGMTPKDQRSSLAHVLLMSIAAEAVAAEARSRGL